jgi:hypothetical protein
MQALANMLHYDDAIVVVNGAQAIEKVPSPTDSPKGESEPFMANGRGGRWRSRRSRSWGSATSVISPQSF